MAYPRKAARNLAIVAMRDDKEATFAAIASEFGLHSRQEAWAIYQREKRRAEREAGQEQTDE